MRTLKNPNAWSCLPTAFAIALQVDLDTVLGIVGHDGSEITHAGLPEPLKRRGFHLQEMIKMCLQDGMSVTPVELCPQAIASNSTAFMTPKLFDIGEWDWFEKNLFTSSGVIDCRTAVGLGHAMAYEGRGTHALIYDPATEEVFEFHKPENTEQRDRFLVALWRIESIHDMASPGQI